MSTITVRRGSLLVEVALLRYLLDDYSFAVALFIVGADGRTIAFLWEIHEGARRIGQMDPNTFQLLGEESGTIDEAGRFQGADGLNIGYEMVSPTGKDMLGKVVFEIPTGRLPAEINQIGALSFHMVSAQEQKNCDQAGPFDLPLELQSLGE
ncbi:MAG: hypothetical protein L0322_01925 [Chloroflexi bacterium]|nr:hypothetical protein [Chloroflexota bacterium]